MSSRDEALVTPLVMKWAREKAGYDVNAAASKLNRPVEDVEGWEDGSLRPSLAQARKAAEVYKRSLAVFYLEEPPKDFETLRDFRRMPVDRDPHPSPALSFIIRQTQDHQEWLRETLIEQGIEKLDFVASSNIHASPEELAAEIRERLGVSVRRQTRCSTRNEALNLWITKAEGLGVYVSRQSHVGRETIECEEVRGFALTDDYAPFVFINSNDAIVAQMFSLMHELVHIWVGQPGISNLGTSGVVLDRSSEQVEVFCNQVASLILLDPATFEELWNDTPEDDDLEDRIESVSNSLKISEEVVARRLLEEDIITRNKYRELRSYYAQRWKQHKADERRKLKEADGGPSPHLLKTIGNGRAFTHTVLACYYSGRLSGAYAAHLLSAKLNHFSKLAEHASVSIGNWRQLGGMR